MSNHLFRVVSRNFGGTYTVWYEGTRSQCRRWILNRNRSTFPPFYAITTRSTDFHKCF